MKSLLQIYDLDAGSVEVLCELDGHYEAPNWHPTEDALVINGGGRLFRVPLDAPKPELIDTGFATLLNNDHGLSPTDGVYYLTDKTETSKACIYRMPAGAPPERLTVKVPSYWHGVSPDGSSLTYAGFRDGICQIMVAQSDGANERILTSGFDHCDGPDFSACGQWIWFNAEQDGVVDLWRIKPDGADLQRMTQDARVNWFPHPSPNGRWVVYLSYPEGTKGHPANLDAELRLLPAEGGQPRELITLFGGQGTLNVPCWSPDGQKFAFMSFVLT